MKGREVLVIYFPIASLPSPPHQLGPLSKWDVEKTKTWITEKKEYLKFKGEFRALHEGTPVDRWSSRGDTCGQALIGWGGGGGGCTTWVTPLTTGAQEGTPVDELWSTEEGVVEEGGGLTMACDPPRSKNPQQENS